MDKTTDRIGPHIYVTIVGEGTMWQIVAYFCMYKGHTMGSHIGLQTWGILSMSIIAITTWMTRVLAVFVISLWIQRHLSFPWRCVLTGVGSVALLSRYAASRELPWAGIPSRDADFAWKIVVLMCALLLLFFGRNFARTGNIFGQTKSTV